ncbi:hypothetical protein SARC_08713 [Sphaeroforma arctica JP610]|uniref:Uncharacterized protein n=1 Tax=Sphaeroforma arctica JP610 TaxID=667725 RepID=A0A0L0FPY5_9EUKA|nr:hypothetical protein SARC_08713 [Sphaeroforma arctica JP610]KNC78875.1 hypothetical protein SARC_08713 [Sphaeroforma arctica JP610]|eukprot:XP_014152777.1 hypothetical protein SARC_08713 [Sphaeroforma arctica JP610]
MAICKDRVRTIHRHVEYSLFPFAGECPTCQKYSMVKPKKWVSGFLNGMFMQLYDWDKASPNPLMADEWMERFIKRIDYLEKEVHDTSTHDIGFKVFYSFGHAYRSTGWKKYLTPTLTAAHSLATRYIKRIGALKSWDTQKFSEPARSMKWPVIVDNMMNLELLLWAGQKEANATLTQMAIQHSLTSLRDLIRDDGCTWHVVDYDVHTAQPKRYVSIPQGYNATSIWTRGCGFAIHGFSTVYKWTKDQRFLDAAQTVSECFLAQLFACCGDDLVPPFDFHDPLQRRDSSAAAISAAALANNYISKKGKTDAILLHGMGDFGKRDEDVPLIYGDYFFIQALSRLSANALKNTLGSKYSRATPASGQEQHRSEGQMVVYGYTVDQMYIAFGLLVLLYVSRRPLQRAAKFKRWR